MAATVLALVVVGSLLLIHPNQHAAMGSSHPAGSLPSVPSTSIAPTTTTAPPIAQTTVVNQQQIANDQAAVAQGQANIQFIKKELSANEPNAQSWANACSQDQQAIQQATDQNSVAEVQSQESVDCSTAEADQATVDRIQSQLQQAQMDLQLTESQLQQDQQG